MSAAVCRFCIREGYETKDFTVGFADKLSASPITLSESEFPYRSTMMFFWGKYFAISDFCSGENEISVFLWR